jgi:hypothetical protein
MICGSEPFLEGSRTEEYERSMSTSRKIASIESDAPRHPLVLSTEKADDFLALQADFEQEIHPRGAIERMYVHEVAALVWEIRRFRHAKTAIINNAFGPALLEIIKRIMPKSEITLDANAERLARGWFLEQKTRIEVQELLAAHDLDDHSVAAEALRQVAPDLERLDRRLTNLELGRDRALQNIADLRAGLAKRVRRASDRVLDDNLLVLSDTHHGELSHGQQATD